MIRSKKGGAQWPLVALFFLVAVVLLIGNDSLVSVKNDIGQTQYDILLKTEQAAGINSYIDKAASLSATQTRTAFLATAGVYQQLTETGDIAPSTCGNYLYPNYKSSSADCTPKYTDAIKKYFDDFFFNYLQHHPAETPLYFLYDLNVAQQSPQQLILQAAGEEVTLPFAHQTQTTPPADLTCKDLFLIRKQYPKTSLGFYTNEKPITCGGGECFAQVGNLLYETYKAQGKEYGYVVNGESPYCPQDVRTLAGTISTNPTAQPQTQPTPSSTSPTDSFFDGLVIPDDRFDQRKELKPGFDSAGWLWWVGKHANISFFDTRKGEASYFNDALAQSPICQEQGQKCTLPHLLANAEPGDIFFLRDDERVDEQGNTIPGGSIRLALYIETDQATGRPVIIHADTTKGLVKEYLPEKYASGQDTTIAAIYRPVYASGSSFLPPDLEIIPPFLGPFEWCSGPTASLPSQKYINQLQAQPFKSIQGTTYYDLAIEQASATGVDPALLITHAVLESSLGQNNKCTAKQKSALTGCGWPGWCAPGCKCSSPSVLSDEAQLACTAETDLGAYKEALAGVHSVVGVYEECGAYQNNPEVFWNCIFCIYQGSYDKVIGKGKLYFTQDQTCEYAERAKDEYCSWRAYFDANWDDLSMLSSLAVSSELTFTPAFSTSTNIDLASLNLITKEFIPSLQDCTNKLEECVLAKVNAFNKKHQATINITRLQKDNGFANDVLEQVLDCRYNGQRDCVCPIVPEYSGYGPQQQDMIFYSNGSFIADGDLLYEFGFNPAIPTSNRSFPQSEVRFEVNGSDNSFLKLKGYVGNSLELSETWHINPEKNVTRTPITTEVQAFGLLKQTYSSMTWIPYQQNLTHLTCKDSKYYFSFQAELFNTGDVLNFSFYLEDTTPSDIWPTTTTTKGTCLDVPDLQKLYTDPLDIISGTTFTSPTPVDIVGLADTVTMHWEAATNQEPLHSFIVQTATTPSFTQLLSSRDVQVATAIPLPQGTTEPPLLEQLFVTSGTVNKYAYKTNKENISGTPYQKNKQYYFRIIPVDAYGNEGQPTQVATFNFTDAAANSGLPLTQQQLDVLLAGTKIALSGVDNFICAYNKYSNLTVDDFLPPTPGNLKVYPGIVDPKDNVTPLYQIAGIDNVVCDETQTKVGKVCAANKELVLALEKLSPELEQNGWIMNITQAYRTWDIQYKLWKGSGFDRSMACNPGSKDSPYLCPHMIAGAIDITIKDSSGNHIGSVAQEAFMCKHLFVRYGKERWHFEMGTAKWVKAETARAGGTCCYYGVSAPEDTRGQTCTI